MAAIDSPDAEARARLAKAVTEARRDLGVSAKTAASQVPMSPVTWGRVERGEPVRPLSYAGVERMLGWAPGSAQTVLAGGDPTPRADAPQRTGYDPEPAPAGSSVSEIDAHYQSIYRKLEGSDIPPAVKERAKAAIDYNYRQAIEAALSDSGAVVRIDRYRETGS